ncbi:hypothetical protein IX317_001858 [Fusobacterium sp. DD29]|uniref:hypothetical protein n=1 Tax=unclassified Fusobacterium TaxID=2648384 RepID=UPI001B8B7A9C|nr:MULTISPECIES: hypothetical protein [unclassified Fusobacterium]MBR8701144.1 hypothetical protein [Fusobacterium sp. DD45]MBR8711343.1 hypothetical protein [Fusobacterium sp. DD28]MBR8750174.1 hypothetical protein [Fusobacterium sp. DD29]MBR8751892.1 hypothetical protein [Fusobacterium sp. DD26]MBR8762416.1 hypothetical protein [Fusobacterium sp. DD25]
MYTVTAYKKEVSTIGDTDFKVILDRLSTMSFTRIKQYKKDFLKKYPEAEIIVKKRVRKGWREIFI